MREADENQEYPPIILSYERRELRIQMAAEKLSRLMISQYGDDFKALAEPSMGMLDPHYNRRKQAALNIIRAIATRE